LGPVSRQTSPVSPGILISTPEHTGTKKRKAHSDKENHMNTISRRIAAGFALAAAPAIIALGAAATSSAQTTIPTTPTVTNTGPVAGHHAYHGQQNFPQPGSTIHHHHQNHR